MSVNIKTGFTNNFIINGSYTKFPGLTIDITLSWNNRIDLFMKTLSTACYIIRNAKTYNLSNKNPLTWNFLSAELEVTWRTVAIIIRVVSLSQYLCIRGLSLSSIHYNICCWSWLKKEGRVIPKAENWTGCDNTVINPELSGGRIPLQDKHSHKNSGRWIFVRQSVHVCLLFKNKLLSFLSICYELAITFWGSL